MAKAMKSAPRAATPRYEGIKRTDEIHLDTQIVDTRSFMKKRLDEISASDSFYINTLYVILGLMILLPVTIDFLFPLSVILIISSLWIGKREKLLFHTPQSYGRHDRDKDVWVDEEGNKLEGMYLFGYDYEFDFRELWFSDSDVRTHMLLFGTTGAGKTEALLSLCYGALITCSGFIYSDGKGTFELFYKVYNTCRSLGQEDDVLLMSFLTGDEDMRKPTSVRISNMLNPFANATQEAGAQMLVALMATNSSGSGDIWTERAAVLMECIMGLLTFRRDHHKQALDVAKIRDTLILNNLYKAYNDSLGVTDPNNPAYLENWVIESLKGYLVSLPGFDENKKFEDQPPTINEQHGYLQMQFTKLLGSLADMYGYIFNTELSEINFWDVVVKRRVLVVLLPALAKSKQELSMLGKIILSCIKAMMTSGLGKKSEGKLEVVNLSNPTKSKTPFITILDEYGYYAVPGAAVMPAQARGLGFFMVFAGQDFPAFRQSGEDEAKAIVANCNIQICMKLQDENDTFNIFKNKAEEAYVAVTGGKRFTEDTKLINSENVQYERRSRISFKDLAGQTNGQAHFFFAEKMARGAFFYAKIDMNGKFLIRVNEFIAVSPPDKERADQIKASFSEVTKLLTNSQYMHRLSEETEDGNSNTMTMESLKETLSVYRKKYGEGSNQSYAAAIAHIMFGVARKMDEIESSSGDRKSVV